MNVEFKQKAVRTLIFAAVVALGAGAGLAQAEKPVGPVKGAVIKGGKDASVAFCIAPDDASAGNYRLKVWQLMQGQTAQSAMASNKVVVTASAHAINTKGAGANDRTAPPAEEKACGDALATPEPAAVAGQRTRTKSNNANDRLAVVVVEGFPPCAKGNSCDYVWTVEEVAPDGATVKLVTSVQNPYMFTINPDGTIKPPTTERRRVEVLKSN